MHRSRTSALTWSLEGALIKVDHKSNGQLGIDISYPPILSTSKSDIAWKITAGCRDEKHIHGLHPVFTGASTTIEDLAHSSAMDVRSEPDEIVEVILVKLNKALASKAPEAVTQLFLPHGVWRDHLASSWNLRTLHGSKDIEQFLSQHFSIRNLSQSGGHEFRKPKYGPLDGISGAEGITTTVDFQSALGQGRGMLRLAENDGQWKIFTLFLSLEEMTGCEEPVGPKRARPTEMPSDDKRNWQERRSDDFNFKDHEPTVLVVGELLLDVAVITSSF